MRIIEVGDSPLGMALRQEPPLLAVALSKEAALALIDPLSLALLPRRIQTDGGPEDVEFSADGRQLFATSERDGTVAAFDVESGSRLGDALHFPATPRKLLRSPDGKRLFVLLFSDPGAMAVVDLSEWKVEATLPVPRFPRDMAVTAEGDRLLVGGFDENDIAVFDLQRLQRVDTINAGDTGFAIATHPTEPYVYLPLTMDDAVLVYDYRRRRRIASVRVGESPVQASFTPDGRFLYVLNNASNNVVKLDTQTQKPLLRLPSGLDPQDSIFFAASEPERALDRALLASSAAVAVLAARRAP